MNKKDWIVAITINACIFAAIGVTLAGAIIGNLKLAIAGFVCIAIVGVLSSVVVWIIKIKSIPPEVRQETARRLNEAKKTLKAMTGKELFKFVSFATIIVLSWLCAVIFGFLKMTVPMLISIGVFMGVPLLIIAVLRFK